MLYTSIQRLSAYTSLSKRLRRMVRAVRQSYDSICGKKRYNSQLGKFFLQIFPNWELLIIFEYLNYIAMIIKNEKEFRDYQANLETLIAKGTQLGNMELLSEEEQKEYIRLSDAIEEYEAAYHPLPGRVSTLLTDTIREKMQEKGINQKQTAKLLGISESRVSDLLNGRRPLNLNIAKRLRDHLSIPADFILDYACV